MQIQQWHRGVKNGYSCGDNTAGFDHLFIHFQYLPGLTYFISWYRQLFFEKAPHFIMTSFEKCARGSWYYIFFSLLPCSQFHDATAEQAEISQSSCSSTSQFIQHRHTTQAINSQGLSLAAVTPMAQQYGSYGEAKNMQKDCVSHCKKMEVLIKCFCTLHLLFEILA